MNPLWTKIIHGFQTGVFLGAVVGLAYWLLLGGSFQRSIPYLVGFLVAMTCYGVLEALSNKLPRVAFFIGLAIAGCMGGFVCFVLTPHAYSIAWFLVGGSVVILLCHIEIRLPFMKSKGAQDS